MRSPAEDVYAYIGGVVLLAVVLVVAFSGLFIKGPSVPIENEVVSIECVPSEYDTNLAK